MQLVGYAELLLVQLRASGRVIGMVSYYARQDAQLSINRISLAADLWRAGRVIGSRINRLQQQANAAVVTKRQRLARELHDAVTQSLYSQSLFTRSAIDALDEGRVATVREHLEQLEVSSMQAFARCVCSSTNFGRLTFGTEDLADAVDQLTLVERRVGIAGNCSFDENLDLDAETEAALYRVILEALNNVLRHAGASRVDVGLHGTPDGNVLPVADDGRGFDVENVSPGLGVSNIRARRLRLGGDISVTSSPGRGTSVTLRVPLTARNAVRPGTPVRRRAE